MSPGKNATALFLVDHAVELGFAGHHAALVTGDHVEPQLGSMNAAVLDAAVATGGDTRLHPEIEVAHGSHLPGNEMIHFERTIRFPHKDAILVGPKFWVARPSPHAAREKIGKAVGSGAVGHGGGGFRIGGGGYAQGAFLGGKRTAQLLDPAVGRLAHFEESLLVLGILGQVDQFVGILPQVVKKLVVALVDVTDVFETVVAQALEGRDAVAHREVLVKGMGAPVLGLAGGDKGLEAPPLVALGNGKARPVEEGGRQVEVEDGLLEHLPADRLRSPGIVDHHGDAQGLLVVGPFARKATVAQVVTVVG